MLDYSFLVFTFFVASFFNLEQLFNAIIDHIKDLGGFFIKIKTKIRYLYYLLSSAYLQTWDRISTYIHYTGSVLCLISYVSRNEKQSLSLFVCSTFLKKVNTKKVHALGTVLSLEGMTYCLLFYFQCWCQL